MVICQSGAYWINGTFVPGGSPGTYGTLTGTFSLGASNDPVSQSSPIGAQYASYRVFNWNVDDARAKLFYLAAKTSNEPYNLVDWK